MHVHTVQSFSLNVRWKWVYFEFKVDLISSLYCFWNIKQFPLWLYTMLYSMFVSMNKKSKLNQVIIHDDQRYKRAHHRPLTIRNSEWFQNQNLLPLDLLLTMITKYTNRRECPTWGVVPGVWMGLWVRWVRRISAALVCKPRWYRVWCSEQWPGSGCGKISPGTRRISGGI